MSVRYRLHSAPGSSTFKHLRLWILIWDYELQTYEFLFFWISLLMSPSRYRWFQVIPARSRWLKLVLGSSSLFKVVQFVPPFCVYKNCNRETKRSQRNEISLNLLFCDYFSKIFTHYLGNLVQIQSNVHHVREYQPTKEKYALGLVFLFRRTDVYLIVNITQYCKNKT